MLWARHLPVSILHFNTEKIVLQSQRNRGGAGTHEAHPTHLQQADPSDMAEPDSPAGQSPGKNHTEGAPCPSPGGARHANPF